MRTHMCFIEVNFSDRNGTFRVHHRVIFGTPNYSRIPSYVDLTIVFLFQDIQGYNLVYDWHWSDGRRSLSDPSIYIWFIVILYQSSVLSFLGVFQCGFCLQDLLIWDTVSWFRGIGSLFYVHCRNYSVEDIFVAHIVDKKDMIQTRGPERGRWIGGEGQIWELLGN